MNFSFPIFQPPAESIPEFRSVANSLESTNEVSRIAQDSLKDKEAVGVKLSDKEVIYYSKTDYDKITNTQKLYHEHAKDTQEVTKTLKGLYDNLVEVPSVDKKTLQEFREAVEACKQSLSHIPENVKSLLQAFQVIEAIEGRLAEYEIDLLSHIKVGDDTSPSIPYGTNIKTPARSPIPPPPPLLSKATHSLSPPASTLPPPPLLESSDSEIEKEEPPTPEPNPTIENDPRVSTLKDSIAMIKEVKSSKDLEAIGIREEDIPSLIANLEEALSTDGTLSQQKIHGNELLQTMAWYTRSLISTFQDLQWRLKDQSKI